MYWVDIYVIRQSHDLIESNAVMFFFSTRTNLFSLNLCSQRAKLGGWVVVWESHFPHVQRHTQHGEYPILRHPQIILLLHVYIKYMSYSYPVIHILNYIYIMCIYIYTYH
jgi:hypothetical protein